MTTVYPELVAGATTFDQATIRNHFHLLHYCAYQAGVPGKLILTGIADKALRLPPDVQHFAIGDIDGMTAAAMAFQGTQYGVYNGWCLMRPDLPDGSKGTKDDVVATLAFPVDADSDHPGKAIPRAPVTPNYIVESSSGNFQEIMILEKALLPDSSRPLAKALGELTGDKMCVVDISRVMRVPGTYNWPSVSKIKRGRSPEPQPVRVTKAWDGSWTKIDDLRAVCANVKPKAAPKITAPVPDAVDGVSHDGIRYAEVVWYCQHMAKVWTADDRFIKPDDFELAKRIKLSFPGEDGLNAVLLLGWDDREEEIRERWWNPNDFKTEGENLLTLHGLKEANWMWRHVFSDCPKPPAAETHYDIPAEILRSMEAERERYLEAQLGPLPDHPELTYDQANSIVKFWAHLPSGKMIYEPTRELWNAGSVDKHLGRIKDAMQANGPGKLASTWLSQYRGVQSVGWDPGQPMVLEDKVLTQDGWLRSTGDRTFNLYVPPDIEHVEGDVTKWLNHIRYVYPNEADHIVMWAAHRVQRPGEKVNHALVFLGKQGAGKDTIITPIIAAVGAHNAKDIKAKDFYGSEWNDYLQSVILRINEVHDLGGESRFGFYDAVKDVITSPPETHRINKKHVPQFAAVNVCGVVLTSNHPDAVYIPQDDRRYFVCVTDRCKEDYPDGYFDDLHEWFQSGGNQLVAHYLASLDIGAFRPKATPPQTAGWHSLVAAGLQPETGDLSDVIEAMGKPSAVILSDIRRNTPTDSQLSGMFNDAKLKRNIPKRLGECGYVAILKPGTTDGRWRMPAPINKTMIYARQELSESDRLIAAKALCVKKEAELHLRPLPPVLTLLPPLPTAACR